jgi:hypothetical protein
MSDKVTTSKELKINMTFVDGDSRTITVDNPKDSLTAAQINAVAAIAKTTQAVIGDKAGAAFHEFDTAKITEKETCVLDLNIQNS